MPRLFKYTLSILLTLVLGSLPAFFSINQVGDWYETMEKPFFNPPKWLFGPAWSTLFILMGIAHARIWIKAGIKATTPYYPQLALNMAWTFLFFGFQQKGLALVEILVLWVMIFWNIRAFYRLDKTAGLLLVPYIGWVSFATVLNASLWWLNR